MTDPSYTGQIITFTCRHIGNVGTNPEDVEALNPHALGAIVRQDVTDPSNFRSSQHFDAWMKSNGRIGISGVDTRALTRLIRVAGAPNAVIAHSASGDFDVPAILARAKAGGGLEGMGLAKGVTTGSTPTAGGARGRLVGLWALPPPAGPQRFGRCGVHPRNRQSFERRPSSAHGPVPWARHTTTVRHDGIAQDQPARRFDARGT